MASGNSNGVAVADVVENRDEQKESRKQIPIRIGERTGTYSEKQHRYDLHPTSDEVKNAVATDYEEYVEADGRAYLKKWLGHIIPTLPIVLAKNLKRKLLDCEGKLLGGPDGDELKIDNWILNAALKNAGVKSIEDLPDDVQKSCKFQPGWGLQIRDGTVNHILNMMLGNEKFRSRKPMVVALSSMKLEDVGIVGNRFCIYINDKVVEKAASGCEWNVSPLTGEVEMGGKGNVLICRKLFAEKKWDYDICAFNLDPLSYMEMLRQVQTQERQRVLSEKRVLSDDFLNDIMDEATAE